MKFKVKKFKELSVTELYAVMKLRQEIFVAEQNCPYVDADGKDLQSVHVMGYERKKLAAYARVVPPGISYKSPSIGRVVVDQKFRGKKYGYLLMEKCIKDVLKRYRTDTITISAQLYLKKFYTNTGFNAVGDVYPEDNIPHIKMIYKK
ncbi:MAG TPA: GNAT family N-acetyltransferase [Bacteroidia bacterium]|jgi:ElaA protein|nr:GNAT family N-acetyltransferase [Bacteroidia bacterium]